MTTFMPIIGLEVHIELATTTKMFCGCFADHFGKPPNTMTCPVCLGLPGALPVPNKKAVEWTMLLGLALNCTLTHESKFDRKHYFYPDLPKGYQISQYDQPLCEGGWLSVTAVDGMKKSIRIHRVHIEEDTGKLIHRELEGQQVALVDFNRSGVPLVEVVTEPDFRTIAEVDQYMKKLQRIVRYLGISTADMEKGTMRIEPSISVQKVSSHISKVKSDALPPYRVEVKNINSFRFARKAITYEIQRQTDLLQRGEKILQQTRGWNDSKGMTVAQREKEEAQDYRYFPEPDIPPMRWDTASIEKLRSMLPELPDSKHERFMHTYGLSDYEAAILVEHKDDAEYFEACAAIVLNRKQSMVTPKILVNQIINKTLNRNDVTPDQFVSLLADDLQKSTISDEALEKVITDIIALNPQAVEDYKKGKQAVVMFLVGLVLKKISGQADATKVITLLKKTLATTSYE